MRSLQGTFPWLHGRLRYKVPGRGGEENYFADSSDIENFQANKVGLNQTLNTCMPTLSKDANYYLHQIHQ